MSQRDDTVTIQQMLDHVEESIALAARHTREALDTNRVVLLALLKLVEIVGEAATRVSQPVQAAHPTIPWREIIGTRNRLIHGYDAVDNNILWDIVTTDFPPLVLQLKQVMENRQ